MGDLFKLRGELTARHGVILGTAGVVFIIFVWYLLTMGADPVIDAGILPKPNDVRTAYKEPVSYTHLTLPTTPYV